MLPDGIDGQTFFQRHAMPGMSNLIELATVSGDRKPYIRIDRPEGLIAVAQIAGVEFIPGTASPARRRCRDGLVFDLDPAPDVAFDRSSRQPWKSANGWKSSGSLASARRPAAKGCMS